MHHTGTDSNEAIECFKMINDKTESFSSKLKRYYAYCNCRSWSY